MLARAFCSQRPDCSQDATGWPTWCCSADALFDCLRVRGFHPKNAECRAPVGQSGADHNVPSSSDIT
jgi:hypothetical protein